MFIFVCSPVDLLTAVLIRSRDIARSVGTNRASMVILSYRPMNRRSLRWPKGDYRRSYNPSSTPHPYLSGQRQTHYAL